MDKSEKNDNAAFAVVEIWQVWTKKQWLSNEIDLSGYLNRVKAIGLSTDGVLHPWLALLPLEVELQPQEIHISAEA